MKPILITLLFVTLTMCEKEILIKNNERDYYDDIETLNTKQNDIEKTKIFQENFINKDVFFVAKGEGKIFNELLSSLKNLEQLSELKKLSSLGQLYKLETLNDKIYNLMLSNDNIKNDIFNVTVISKQNTMNTEKYLNNFQIKLFNVERDIYIMKRSMDIFRHNIKNILKTLINYM